MAKKGLSSPVPQNHLASNGVYVLMEKIKRDNDRIDISKLEPNEIAGDDVIGKGEKYDKTIYMERFASIFSRI